MNQPDRVSLVFPRSGQQVFVNVPPHIREAMDARHFDHKLHSTTTSYSTSYGNSDLKNNPAQTP
jgi:hypothetical protein